MRARFEWRPFLAAFLGAGAVMIAYGYETQRGNVLAVRYGWMALVPPVLSGVTVAALALTIRRPRGPGMDLANLSVTAMCTHLFLVIQLPLAPGELPRAAFWAALDIAGWVSVPILLLLILQLSILPERRRALLGAMLLASVLMLARVAFEIAQEPTIPRASGAFLGVLSCYAALRVAGPRAPRPR